MGLPDGFSPQVLLVDPPRKGLEPSVIESLGRQPLAELLYVSCDPASLARDAKALAGLGYRLASSQGVDLFPQTAHVESVNRFIRP
jgi:23S rRNA (uracil1939-C5)-methyltransferase